MNAAEEKQTNTREETSNAAEKSASEREGRKKPVIIYILILFIVAFMMMALSLLVHQRSNAEALGQLSDSVTAMQGIQATQQKIIELQDSLSQTQEALIKANENAEVLTRRVAASQSDAERARREWEALTALYNLQQLFAAREYESCNALLAEMEEKNYPSLLSGEAESSVTPPAEQYQSLKAAVEAELSAAP